MTAEAVRIISLPSAETTPRPQAVPQPSNEVQQQMALPMDLSPEALGPVVDPFASLADAAGSADQAHRTQERVLAEIHALESQNRWQDIVDLFYPVDDHAPQLCAHGLDIEVRSDLAFALGQLKRFDQALAELRICVKRDPGNFRYRSSLGYTLMSSLQAASAREIILPGQERKARLEQAHEQFRAAQSILPDRVTPFYREGRLYKDFDRKPDRAIPLLAQAVRNWDDYSRETKLSRHQERKNAIKARYALASCLVDEGQASTALEHVRMVIEEDAQTGYLKNEHKHFALGKALHALGHSEEALKALAAAAMFTNPSDGDYVFELSGRCHLALGQADKGLESVERIPHKVRRPYVRWTEADCLTALGRTDEAKRVLLACCERDRRGRHKGLIRLARLAYNQNLFADVAAYAEKAVAFHMEVYSTPCADGLFWQAVAALRQGRRDEALAFERDLVAHRPRYPWLPKLRQALHGGSAS